jgi:citrate lyase subunit beta / citryl-CoA lyase
VTRPLRSWMFVPGNRQRFIDKAFEIEVDAIFLDLEDGVPPDQKRIARTLIANALESQRTGPLRVVRLNAVDSEWFREDMSQVLVPGLECVCIPKIEEPDEVRTMARHLAAFERDHGLADGTVRIVAAIESARGLLAAPQIASSDPRVLALMLGAEDYALDLGLGTERVGEAKELVHARSALVVAAASVRVLSIDGVFPDLDDDDGMRADVVQARRLGFSAKSTFHPKQVEEINRVFSPSPDEIAYARKVVDAFDSAQARGDGSVAVGGQLVDRPIVLRAQRLLELVARGDPAMAASSERGR